jgi:hypothetical protein
VTLGAHAAAKPSAGGCLGTERSPLKRPGQAFSQRQNTQVFLESRELAQVNRSPQPPRDKPREVDPQDVCDAGPPTDRRELADCRETEPFLLCLCLPKIPFSGFHQCNIATLRSKTCHNINSPGTHSRIYLCAQPQNACVRCCYPMRQNPQKCCLPCRLGTIIDFRVSGRHFAPALAKRSVKQTPHCLAAHGEHTASKNWRSLPCVSELRFIISRGDYS